jgi:hypothetical protein
VLRQTSGTRPATTRTLSPRPCRVGHSTRLGRRIDELIVLFTAAVPAEGLTKLRREKILEAAQCKALAEAERGVWMRGEARCSLDELVRLERRADAAVRALGLVERAPQNTPSLQEYVAQKTAAKAAGKAG